MFNKPHRDVQSAGADFTVSSNALVQEYLADANTANQKYLDETGDSKIMAVTGKVHSISRDMNNQIVVLLQEDGDKAGVSCTFTAATNPAAEKLSVGKTVTVKGVIRSGAGYDADLDMYEDVILEKCDVLNNNN
jgi:tRNA(Ile2) C34 agmatinyltransferase TiaS